ncbi:hypothetical protein MKFW12EY_38060 [Methylomonas koyamae]|nr:hypothetical protein MKFW12EY_38060 [Methylomonas koyamae]
MPTAQIAALTKAAAASAAQTAALVRAFAKTQAVAANPAQISWAGAASAVYANQALIAGLLP